jgi:diguanylate cyclase (GGDEF)-like protein
VSDALQRRTREIDAVGRLGGDEFAVLIPGAAETEARVVAEDLRKAISRSLDGEDHQLTVSIGVASGRPPVPEFEELWRSADAAMYAGKRAGGDRVGVMPARAGGAEESVPS